MEKPTRTIRNRVGLPAFACAFYQRMVGASMHCTERNDGSGRRAFVQLARKFEAGKGRIIPRLDGVQTIFPP
jgi:hypothetical protein